MTLIKTNVQKDNNQTLKMLEMMKTNGVNLLNVGFQLTNKPYLFKGDYSESDLLSLEQCISDLYPSTAEAPLINTFIPYGFYLGETIVNNVPNAMWDIENVEDGDLFEVKIFVPHLKNIDPIRPFKKVRSFWLNGKEGLVDVFNACKVSTA